MIKRFIFWILGSWTGSMVGAVMLSAAIFGGFFLYQKSSKGFAQQHDLPPEIKSQGVLFPINSFGIPFQWNQLQPDIFGVNAWRQGDTARYLLKDPKRTGEREITFKVLAPLTSEHLVAQHYQMSPEGNFWLQVSGFKGFRDIPETLYHLANPSDMRITNTWLSFRYKDNYIPLHNSMYERHAIAPFAKLTKLGQEEIETQAGRFLTDRYQATLGSATLELWTHPQVSPLGIVRIEGEDQSLELLSFCTGEDGEIPNIMRPLIDGISTLKDGCSSCHQSAEECHVRVFPPT